MGTGGGGLIGLTPLPAGYVTGNAAADLQTQLAAVLTYNQIWSSYLPALNSAASPADAADIYVTDFERAGIPAAATREASAAGRGERLRHLAFTAGLQRLPGQPVGPAGVLGADEARDALRVGVAHVVGIEPVRQER